MQPMKTLIRLRGCAAWFVSSCDVRVRRYIVSHFIGHILTLCMLGNFACFFVVCGYFFKLTFLQKYLSGIPSECQTVWIQIKPGVLPGLIWVQTVCKGYQQTTKVATSMETVKTLFQQILWTIPKEYTYVYCAFVIFQKVVFAWCFTQKK